MGRRKRTLFVVSGRHEKQIFASKNKPCSVVSSSSSLSSTISITECFGLLNDFFPIMSVLNAVLPITYSSDFQVIFNIILPPIFGPS